MQRTKYAGSSRYDVCMCNFYAVPGIFSLLEMLDFGLLRTMDDPSVLRLNIINSGIKPIQIVVSFVFVSIFGSLIP